MENDENSGDDCSDSASCFELSDSDTTDDRISLVDGGEAVLKPFMAESSPAAAANDPSSSDIRRDPEHEKKKHSKKRHHIATLKKELLTRTTEMERIEQERRNMLSILSSQTALRKIAIQKMFNCRAAAEMDREKWAELLEEDFTMVLPITPYRSFPPSQMINGQRILKGIDSVVLDSASLNVMIQSIAPPPDDDGKVIVQILSHNGDSIMVGEILMGKWHLTTTNATERGCLCDIVASGMLKATFSPGSNKLLYMEQTFDVMSFMQQLRQASGKFEFFVVPNTPLLAQEGVQEARIIIDATPPHNVFYLSKTWSNLYGHTLMDIFGQSINELFCAASEADGHGTKEALRCLERGFPCSTVLTIKAANGYPVRSWARLYPLYSMGKVSQFMVVMQALDEGNGPNAQAYPTFTTKNLAANSSSLEAHRVLLEAEAAGAAAGALAEAGSSTQERNRQCNPKHLRATGTTTTVQIKDTGVESSSIQNYAAAHGIQGTSESDAVLASTISSKSMNNHSRCFNDNSIYSYSSYDSGSGYGDNAELTDANLHNPARGTAVPNLKAVADQDATGEGTSLSSSTKDGNTVQCNDNDTKSNDERTNEDSNLPGGSPEQDIQDPTATGGNLPGGPPEQDIQDPTGTVGRDKDNLDRFLTDTAAAAAAAALVTVSQPSISLGHTTDAGDNNMTSSSNYSSGDSAGSLRDTFGTGRREPHPHPHAQGVLNLNLNLNSKRSEALDKDAQAKALAGTGGGDAKKRKEARAAAAIDITGNGGTSAEAVALAEQTRGGPQQEYPKRRKTEA